MCTSSLTRRDEGVLDCIALDEVAQYAVHTLNDVSIKSLHLAHSIDCPSVLCITLDWVHGTREGSDKDFTTLHCLIVYPAWVSGNISVPTDEGELVWTVSPLELQGDIEGSCEVTTTRHIWVYSTRGVTTLYIVCRQVLMYCTCLVHVVLFY